MRFTVLNGVLVLIERIELSDLWFQRCLGLFFARKSKRLVRGHVDAVLGQNLVPDVDEGRCRFHIRGVEFIHRLGYSLLWSASRLLLREGTIFGSTLAFES